MTVAPPTVGAGVAVPGFTIVELVSESGPWVIYDSVAQDGARVRIKTARAQYPRVRDLAELRREYDILTRLALPGVIAARALVPHGAGNLALVTESFGDSLAHILAARSGSPLPIDAFFTLVIRLARILGELHERHVVHKDVAPHSIFVDIEHPFAGWKCVK